MPLDNISELRRRVPGGKYALTRAVAERARQLQSGTTPLVEVRTPNPLSVAIDEIVQGKVSFTLHDGPIPKAVEEAPEAEAAADEVVSEAGEAAVSGVEVVADDAPTIVDAGLVDAESADASGDGLI